MSAKINGCVGNVLFDSGAQVSLINEKFINKHKHQFKRTPILPVKNTMLTTATGDTQIIIICKQALISIFSQGIEIEVPVIIVKNLVYDVISVSYTHLDVYKRQGLHSNNNNIIIIFMNRFNTMNCYQETK